jgi:copper homeostasis protein
MRNRPLVEVCVSSVADALAAVDAGADRLELCSALEVGGLTPSVALLQSVLEQATVPVMAMIRPRTGGFNYEPDEFRTALSDAEWALSLGAGGIVFGFLTRDAHVDVERCREMIAVAEGRQTVFHRAFDFAAEPFRAAEQLVELGAARVLTSGQRPTALEGAALIRAVADRTRGNLEVLPGGGIRPENVLEVVKQTGCDQVHVGASRAACDGSLSVNRDLDLVSPGLVGASSRALDATKVSELSNRLKATWPNRKAAAIRHID